MAVKKKVRSSSRYYNVTYYRGNLGKIATTRVKGCDTQVQLVEMTETGGLFEVIDSSGKAVFSIPFSALIECVIDATQAASPLVLK